MPLTSKGRKIKAAMREEYGKEKGDAVFYASQNKGTITGTHKAAGNPGHPGSTGRVERSMKRMGASDAEAIMAHNKAERDANAKAQRRY